MAEIKLTRIKSLYGELKGYLNSLNESIGSGPHIVPKRIGENFNSLVDELIKVSDTDYSRSKIPDDQIKSVMNIRLVKPLIEGLVSRLQQEYGFNEFNVNTPVIAIMNENSNKVTVQTNYTLNNLIEQISDSEGKHQLQSLDNELSKESKNWEKIKGILIWIINFSSDLFLKVLPIILEKYK